MIRPRCLLLLALVVAPAQASIVPREGVTLGRLTDDSDHVVLARVTRVGIDVELTVERALKGGPAATLTLPRSPQVGLTPGERAVFFLRRDRRQAGAPLRALRSGFQREPVTSPAVEASLLAAVQSRLPRLGAGPPPAAALFDQLASPAPRVREDAAWDLLAARRHLPSKAERGALRRALDLGPNEPLLRLAARWPSPDLHPGALLAARGPDPALRRLAATALQAIDPARTLVTVRADVAQPDPQVAGRAVELAGALVGADATQVLVGALGATPRSVRLEALRALAERPLEPADVAALARHALASTKREAEHALAALALAGPGQALADLARNHPDPETRRVAEALRGAPVVLGRQLLRR